MIRSRRCSTTVKYRLDGASERFDVDAERHAGIFLPKLRRNLSNRVDRIEDVNHDGQFRLQTGRHAVCTENLIRVDGVMESPKLAE